MQHLIARSNAYADQHLQREKRQQELALLGQVCRKVPIRNLIPSSDVQFIRDLCQNTLRNFNDHNPDHRLAEDPTYV